MTKPAIPLAFLTGCLAAASPLAAQPKADDYETIVRIMRECARIGDIEARVACYDNTIGLERLMADRLGASSTATAQRPPVPALPPPATPATKAPSGFGSESVPRSAYPAAREAEAGSAILTVSSARERTPGIYLLTMDDGAQWQFVDTVLSSYTPPARGSTVEIKRGALGSFMMSYRGQPTVRIRRVK